MLEQQRAKKQSDIEKALAAKEAELEEMRRKVASASAPGKRKATGEPADAATPTKQLRADATAFVPGGAGGSKTPRNPPRETTARRAEKSPKASVGSGRGRGRKGGRGGAAADEATAPRAEAAAAPPRETYFQPWATASEEKSDERGARACKPSTSTNTRDGCYETRRARVLVPSTPSPARRFDRRRF